MRWIDACAWGLALAAVVGCSLCAAPYDGYYAAYGGLTPRANMAQGRVGSVFDPAGELARGQAVSEERGEPQLEQLPDVSPSTPSTDEGAEPLPEGAGRADDLPSVLQGFLPAIDEPPVRYSN
jgi:hypothetical protein